MLIGEKTPVVLTQATDTESDIFTGVCMCDSAHHAQKVALILLYLKGKISLSRIAEK